MEAKGIIFTALESDHDNHPAPYVYAQTPSVEPDRS